MEKKNHFLQWCKRVQTSIPHSLLVTHVAIPETDNFTCSSFGNTSMELWCKLHVRDKQRTHSPYSEACLGTFWYYNEQSLYERYKMFLAAGTGAASGLCGDFPYRQKMRLRIPTREERGLNFCPSRHGWLHWTLSSPRGKRKDASSGGIIQPWSLALLRIKMSTGTYFQEFCSRSPQRRKTLFLKQRTAWLSGVFASLLCVRIPVLHTGVVTSQTECWWPF